MAPGECMSRAAADRLCKFSRTWAVVCWRWLKRIKSGDAGRGYQVRALSRAFWLLLTRGLGLGLIR
jgi:hypothetical protein